MIDITSGIQVGGLHFSVVVDDKAHRRLIADNDAGQCDMRNLTIELDKDALPELMSKTFIHEVVEAVCWVYCNDKIEHEKITQLSFGIHQAMESLGVRFGVKVDGNPKLG